MADLLLPNMIIFVYIIRQPTKYSLSDRILGGLKIEVPLYFKCTSYGPSRI